MSHKHVLRNVFSLGAALGTWESGIHLYVLLFLHVNENSSSLIYIWIDWIFKPIVTFNE